MKELVGDECVKKLDDKEYIWQRSVNKNQRYD